MVAHTSWVWQEEERPLLPQPLCYCTFSKEVGGAVVPHSIPVELEMGSLLLLPAAASGGSWYPRKDGAPQLHAVMLSTWPFLLLLPKRF